MLKAKKILFVVLSSALVNAFMMILGNAFFWNELVHHPGEVASQAESLSMFIVFLYTGVCITYFVNDTVKRNALFTANFAILVAFGSKFLGETISSFFPNNQKLESLDFINSFYTIMTVIAIVIGILYYRKNKYNDLRPSWYMKFLAIIPMFKELKINQPTDLLVNERKDTINLVKPERNKDIVNEHKVKPEYFLKKTKPISHEDTTDKKRYKKREVIDNPLFISQLTHDQSVTGLFEKVLKNPNTPPSKSDYNKIRNEVNRRIETEKNSSEYINYLTVNNIDKKLYEKTRNFFGRTIFKKHLNPYNRIDREMLEWDELKLLNKMGLIRQEEFFPYMVTIINDSKSIELAFEFKWYNEGRSLYLPDSNNLDQLKNGYEFVKYVELFLEENKFLNIEILSNFDKNGADILAEKDNLRFAFQCKYYSSEVGKSSVKEIINGANYHYARVPVVVTNSVFNSNAEKHAELYNVQLWDRFYLLRNKGGLEAK